LRAASSSFRFPYNRQLGLRLVFLVDPPSARNLFLWGLGLLLDKTMRDQDQSTLILRIGKRHADVEGLEFEQPAAQVPKLLRVEELPVVAGDPNRAISLTLSP
jgi:hypothetical protein